MTYFWIVKAGVRLGRTEYHTACETSLMSDMITSVKNVEGLPE